MTKSENDALIADMRTNAASAGPPPSSIVEERKGFAEMMSAIPVPEDFVFRHEKLGGRVALWCVPPQCEDSKNTILYLHGGAFCVGAPEAVRGLAGAVARAAGARSVALAYRLAPEYPYPAAVDDVELAYRDLLDRGFPATNIALAGDSAGGGLTLAALGRIRDAGLPTPAAGLLISPWLDLTLSGASIAENSAKDPVISRELLALMAARYDPTGSADASPLAVKPQGLPPLLIQVGDPEILRDDAVRLAKKVTAAGGSVELRIWPHMVHVWHIHAHRLSEARSAIAEAGNWLGRHWKESTETSRR